MHVRKADADPDRQMFQLLELDEEEAHVMRFDFVEEFRRPHPFSRLKHEKGCDYGWFEMRASGYVLYVMATSAVDPSAMGWEHVSVSRLDKCPTWEDMCKIKDLFWEEEDLVMQFHPPKSKYVNYAKNCLHLWRQTKVEIPCPEPILVGPK